MWEKYRREEEGELRKEWDFVLEKVLKLLRYKSLILTRIAIASRLAEKEYTTLLILTENGQKALEFQGADCITQKPKTEKLKKTRGKQ